MFQWFFSYGFLYFSSAHFYSADLIRQNGASDCSIGKLFIGRNRFKCTKGTKENRIFILDCFICVDYPQTKLFMSKKCTKSEKFYQLQMIYSFSVVKHWMGGAMKRPNIHTHEIQDLSLKCRQQILQRQTENFSFFYFILFDDKNAFFPSIMQFFKSIEREIEKK